jgi:hypothetical protein
MQGGIGLGEKEARMAGSGGAAVGVITGMQTPTSHNQHG